MKLKVTNLGIAGCAVIVLMILLSCRQRNKPAPPKGFEKVEAPKEAYSELKNPDPIQVKEITADKIQLRGHSFLFSVAGKEIPDDINEAGEIISVSDKELVIKSPERGDITMQYSLPGELRLPVKKGENFGIDFRHRDYSNTAGYTLLNYSGKELVHASARITEADTISVSLSRGISIFQAPGKKGEEKQSEFGTVRDVPVYLRVNSRTLLLTPGKAQEAEIAGAKFTVLVLISVEMQSSEQKRSSSEGDGFTLEYALVKKSIIN